MNLSLGRDGRAQCKWDYESRDAKARLTFSYDHQFPCKFTNKLIILQKNIFMKIFGHVTFLVSYFKDHNIEISNYHDHDKIVTKSTYS